MRKFALLPLTLLLLSACTKKSEIDISTVGDTMAFNRTEIVVAPGAEITLTFKNNGTSAAMQHNWVLIQPGKDQEVVTASMAAGPGADYVANSPDIIAKTKLTKPGETDTIKFKAPVTPGSYPYVCTFPGHYPLMKGTLRVE